MRQENPYKHLKEMSKETENGEKTDVVFHLLK